MKKEIFAERQIWTNAIAVHIGMRRPDNRFEVMRPGPMEAIEEGAYLGEPSMHLQYEEAQRLMDEFWRCGLRPSEGTGSAGSLAATERHLNDMQVVAMGLLRKNGVQI